MKTGTWKLQAPALLDGAEAGFLPWRQVTESVEELAPMGTMMTGDETRYLHYLGRNLYHGAGAIVDLGPLAGGSTFALASGLAKNCNPSAASATIDSYDLWEFYEDWQRFFKGRKLARLDDIEPHFIENMGRFKHMVRTHRGDIARARWSGAAVEILFIDVAKSPAAMENIVRQFYPCLVPGRSIVIQQDFVSAECPWIHAIQERLSDYFEVVDSPDGGSVSFRPTRAIPDDPLGRDFRYEGLRLDEVDALLGAAEARLSGWYRLCVRAARANAHAMLGDAAGAERLLAGIRASADHDVAVDFDVELVSRAIGTQQKPRLIGWRGALSTFRSRRSARARASASASNNGGPD